jgi:voltage-gated potassium channel
VNPLGRSQQAYDRFTAAVEVPMTVLAVLWLPVLIVPVVVRVRPDVADALNTVDYLVWAAFAVEYLIKLYLTPSKGRFVLTHLVDLAVIIVPVLRPLRLLRLLRLLTFGRAGLTLVSALKRSKEVLTHRGLHFVLLSVLAIVGVGAALEFAFEQHTPGATIHNYSDALWWATVTVTTVGYGDKYPVSGGGRGIAVVLMLTGIGLVGVLSATVASYFVGQRADKDMTELHRRLDRIEAVLTRALPPDDGDDSLFPVHAVVQDKEREAEHPERVLGSQFPGVVDIHVEPLGEAAHRGGGERAGVRFDIGQVVSRLV